jgi:hypothetical protein
MHLSEGLYPAAEKQGPISVYDSIEFNYKPIKYKHAVKYIS